MTHIAFSNQYDNSESSVLARIIGFHIGDGTIGFHSSNNSTLKGAFAVKYYEDALRIYDDLAAVGIASNLYDKKRYGGYSLALGVESCKKLISLGAPVGVKVATDFTIPEWILNGNLRQKAEFLGGLSGAEGGIQQKRVHGQCTHS